MDDFEKKETHTRNNKYLEYDYSDLRGKYQEDIFNSQKFIETKYMSRSKNSYINEDLKFDDEISNNDNDNSLNQLLYNKKYSINENNEKNRKYGKMNYSLTFERDVKRKNKVFSDYDYYSNSSMNNSDNGINTFIKDANSNEKINRNNQYNIKEQLFNVNKHNSKYMFKKSLKNQNQYENYEQNKEPSQFSFKNSKDFISKRNKLIIENNMENSLSILNEIDDIKQINVKKVENKNYPKFKELNKKNLKNYGENSIYFNKEVNNYIQNPKFSLNPVKNNNKLGNFEESIHSNKKDIFSNKNDVYSTKKDIYSNKKDKSNPPLIKNFVPMQNFM